MSVLRGALATDATDEVSRLPRTQGTRRNVPKMLRQRHVFFYGKVHLHLSPLLLGALKMANHAGKER